MRAHTAVAFSNRTSGPNVFGRACTETVSQSRIEADAHLRKPNPAALSKEAIRSHRADVPEALAHDEDEPGS